jgi:hypothetical protein
MARQTFRPATVPSQAELKRLPRQIGKPPVPRGTKALEKAKNKESAKKVK